MLLYKGLRTSPCLYSLSNLIKSFIIKSQSNRIISSVLICPWVIILPGSGVWTFPIQLATRCVPFHPLSSPPTMSCVGHLKLGPPKGQPPCCQNVLRSRTRFICWNNPVIIFLSCQNSILWIAFAWETKKNIMYFVH